jgi:hypothetical protein
MERIFVLPSRISWYCGYGKGRESCNRRGDRLISGQRETLAWSHQGFRVFSHRDNKNGSQDDPDRRLVTCRPRQAIPVLPVFENLALMQHFNQ